MSQQKRVQQASTNTPVNLLNIDSKAYVADAPQDGKEYVRRGNTWVDVSVELKMARWFAKTERVITNTTMPDWEGRELPATVRRVKVGNIYLYRVYVKLLPAQDTVIEPGDYILGLPEDYPELSGYEYSAQMSAPVFFRRSNGGLVIAPTVAGLIQPNGIIIHAPTIVNAPIDSALIFEATRSHMGPWAPLV